MRTKILQLLCGIGILILLGRKGFSETVVTFAPRTVGPDWYRQMFPCFSEGTFTCPPESWALADALLPHAPLPYTFSQYPFCQKLREQLLEGSPGRAAYPKFGSVLSFPSSVPAFCSELKNSELVTACRMNGSSFFPRSQAVLDGFATHEADEQPLTFESALQSAEVHAALTRNDVAMPSIPLVDGRVNGMIDQSWHHFGFAQNFAGSFGEGVGLIDIENATIEAATVHKDLPPILFEAPSTAFPIAKSINSHPSNVLGLILAKPQAHVTGLSPAVRARVLSIHSMLSGDGICKAALDGQPGDIILVEQQLNQSHLLQNGQVTEIRPIRPLPVETLAENFRAIQLAVDAGFIVIEPLGNQSPGTPGLDLDHLEPYAPRFAFRSGDPDYDSGAILVAGLNKVDHTPTSNTNVTRLADTASIADGVNTTHIPERSLEVPRSCSGPSDRTALTANARASTFSLLENRVAARQLPIQDSYTCFGGTSAAAAVVAAAVASVQGIYKAHYGRLLDPGRMRLLVRRFSQGDALDLQLLLMREPEFLAIVPAYIRSVYKEVWGVLPARSDVMDGLRYLAEPGNSGLIGLKREFEDKRGNILASALGEFAL